MLLIIFVQFGMKDKGLAPNIGLFYLRLKQFQVRFYGLYAVCMIGMVIIG
jgi:hypothetical protein